MNNNILKFVTILIVAIIFIYGFSTSYSSSGIDNIAYVIALGVDLAEDGKNLKVTFEFTDISSFSTKGSSENSSPILNTVTACCISDAINLMDAYAGKQINLTHCKIVIFSQEIAEKGILSEITELINDIDVRPSINVVVSKDDAIDYIKNSTSSLEKVVTKYYDIFANSSDYTGYISNITLGEFYNTLIDSDSGSVAILGGVNQASSKSESSSSSEGQSSNGQQSQDQQKQENSEDQSQEQQGTTSESQSSESSIGDSEKPNQISQNNSTGSPEKNSYTPNGITSATVSSGESSIVGERGTENIGLAVFKDSKFVGTLNATETLCHSLIKDEVDYFWISIKTPGVEDSITNVSLLEESNTKISVDTSGDKPVISLTVYLKGRILNVLDNTELITDSNSDSLNNAVTEYLKTNFTDYLKKTSSEYHCDIDDFHKVAKRHFLTNKDWEDYDWTSKYKDAEFKIDVNVNLFFTSSILE